MPCGMVGTLGIGRPPAAGQAHDAATAQSDVVSTGLTTPDPVQLQAALRRFAGTLVTVVMSVTLARYLPPAAATDIGQAAGAVISGG